MSYGIHKNEKVVLPDGRTIVFNWWDNPNYEKAKKSGRKYWLAIQVISGLREDELLITVMENVRLIKWPNGLDA